MKQQKIINAAATVLIIVGIIVWYAIKNQPSISYIHPSSQTIGADHE